MRVLIEEYKYKAADVKGVLHGINVLEDIEGCVSFNYVGYFYNTELKDCVFILPKVFLESHDGKDFVFGNYAPEKVIDIDKNKEITTSEKNFIYEFSVWIYRAIVVYQSDHQNSNIVFYKKIINVGQGARKQTNTFLDVLLALQKFNKENQSFFFFVLRNIHSGYNKINWTRTIAKSNAIVQDNRSIYLNPVNKKRQINFDEELLIIFFSILHYLNKHYGFPVDINCNFPLIQDRQFEMYLRGVGKNRLLQIKYKYFSDKALELWNLCYAFFDTAKQVRTNSTQQEYLLVKNFNIVFEAIIDELIGEKDIPKGLQLQEDGKRVDHMFTYKDLASSDDNKSIYYIGDSKYYKRDNEIDNKSVYKQFTYARNVIQWNLDLFLNNDDEDKEWKEKVPILRDEVTEGYNIIPNFFISAKLDKDLSYIDTIDKTDRKKNKHIQSHFKNRLFDRDTLLITHYDVNFLFIVSLYARNNASQKLSWKNKVRNLFRKEIQETLSEKYNFYAMTPREGIIADSYIEQNFRQLIGKIYAPYENLGPRKYFSLALDKDKEFEIENASLFAQLEKSFYIKSCPLGKDPRDLSLEDDATNTQTSISPDFLTMHYLERHLDKSILIGCYKGEEHLEWILGKNDRGSLIYNIRLGKDVEGGQIKFRLDKMVVSFVVLYEFGHESENKYRVFHVHHHASMDKKRLIKTLYPSEPNSEKYFCYVFDEEVTLGDLDISALLTDKTESGNSGAPIFVTGEELLKYRN